MLHDSRTSLRRSYPCLVGKSKPAHLVSTETYHAGNNGAAGKPFPIRFLIPNSVLNQNNGGLALIESGPELRCHFILIDGLTGAYHIVERLGNFRWGLDHCTGLIMAYRYCSTHTGMRTKTILPVSLAIYQDSLQSLIAWIVSNYRPYVILDGFVVGSRDHGQTHSVRAVQNECIEGTDARITVSNVTTLRGNTYAPSPNRRTSMGSPIVTSAGDS